MVTGLFFTILGCSICGLGLKELYIYKNPVGIPEIAFGLFAVTFGVYLMDRAIYDETYSFTDHELELENVNSEFSVYRMRIDKEIVFSEYIPRISFLTRKTALKSLTV